MAHMVIIGATTTQHNEPGPNEGIGSISDHVKIIGQKVVSDLGSTAFTDANIGKAYSDAVLAGARIISNGWICRTGGCLDWDTTAFWIRKADSAGVLVFFPSGNSEQKPSVRWPATSPTVISVGASDSVNGRWNYSCYGPELDIVAPSGDLDRPCKLGCDVVSRGHFWTLDQMGALGVNNGSRSCFGANADYNCNFGGTSAAVPQAAGVAALALLRRPDLVGQTGLLRDILRYSADRTPWGHADTTRLNDKVGWGRLNAARALSAVTRGDADNNGNVTVSDAVYIINYIFAGGLAPVPSRLNGDSDGNGLITISDAVFLINYIFAGGIPPKISFSY